jgi:hypothetical protein
MKKNTFLWKQGFKHYVCTLALAIGPILKFVDRGVDNPYDDELQHERCKNSLVRFKTLLNSCTF